jgi:hypothetical protein
VTVIRAGRTMTVRGWICGVVFSSGGIALCGAALFGLPGRDPSQRAFAVLFGLAMLVFGVLVLMAVGTAKARLTVDAAGLSVDHGLHDAFVVPWDDLAGVRLWRERRWVGGWPRWHYTLELDPLDELPDLELWKEGARYRYALGRLGFLGRRLDRALARHCPGRYRGLADS